MWTSVGLECYKEYGKLNLRARGVVEGDSKWQKWRMLGWRVERMGWVWRQVRGRGSKWDSGWWVMQM